MSVFAAAVDALFMDPNLASPADYVAKGSTVVVAVRVASRQPDTQYSVLGAELHGASNIFDVRASEVAAPKKGDRLKVGGTTYEVSAPPTADRDRLIWTLGCVPVA